MSNSCIGCKFLFTRDVGYSNWTVEDTEAHCVLNKNEHLPEEIPDDVRGYKTNYEWISPDNDPWYATRDSRCEQYVFNPDKPVHVDCDGDEIMTEDAAQAHFFKTGDGMPLRITRYFGKDI
jgi:hypothetical protein